MKKSKISWLITIVIMICTLAISLMNGLLYGLFALIITFNGPINYVTFFPYNPIMILLLITTLILFYKKNVFGFFLSIIYSLLILLGWFMYALHITQFSGTLTNNLFNNFVYLASIGLILLIFTIISIRNFDFSKLIKE
jgi:hypothetical protein